MPKGRPQTILALKNPALMRTIAALLVEDVSDLCARMARLNRHELSAELDRPIRSD
jgi:hypothetical protein